MDQAGQAVMVVLEGVDGCGKSTVQEMVAQRLRGYGLKVLTLSDPGVTKVGLAVRGLLGIDGGDRVVHTMPMTRMLLYQAARVELEQTLLWPGLVHSDVILLDRWVPSTYAYQVLIGGLNLQMVKGVVESTCHCLQADVALYLSVNAKELKKRLVRRDQAAPPLATLEGYVQAYDTMVRDGSGWQGDHWHGLDATLPLEDVVTAVTELTYGMVEARRVAR